MRLPALVLLGLCCLLVLASCGTTRSEHAPSSDAGAADDREPLAFSRVDATTATGWSEGDLGAEQPRSWRAAVPDIEDVSISSSADDEEQSAMWLAPPEQDGPRPLLVALHSWSSGYRQDIGIPYAQWADEHGWAFIHPDFRGANERPESTGSDLAVQDVIDAIDWASEQADIDERRVFVVGFSGGGQMALLMAGRHPDRFAGAVAWVPIVDLERWFVYNRELVPGGDYARQIRASCGGDPTRDAGARDECRQRSPSAHLDAAREAGVPIYIGHGLDDTTVTPDDALRSFNAVADEDDRFGAATIAALGENRLPDSLRGRTDAEAHFGSADPAVLHSRRSGAATVAIFDGEHDMVYNPGLAWIVRTANAAAASEDDSD